MPIRSHADPRVDNLPYTFSSLSSRGDSQVS
jgi:hypothetical protein